MQHPLNRTAPIALAALGMILSPVFADSLTFDQLQKCTGYDEMDPVAIADDPDKQPVANRLAISVKEDTMGFVFYFGEGSLSRALIFYTPFLYTVQAPSGQMPTLPTDIKISKRTLLDSYVNSLKLTFKNSKNNPIENAIVDFSAFYPGSSPYTMTADNNGVIEIKCITKDDAAINYSVRDNKGEFLGDGSLALKNQITTGEDGQTSIEMNVIVKRALENP